MVSGIEGYESILTAGARAETYGQGPGRLGAEKSGKMERRARWEIVIFSGLKDSLVALHLMLHGSQAA